MLDAVCMTAHMLYVVSLLPSEAKIGLFLIVLFWGRDLY